ncbi:hypothetical protein Cni_G13481 [Canna indica]|uniref:Protein SLOW GREEN 1, chloroplastic n=1 Tax=Canna indica TaxID=4628 RepID=A0AAQ3KBB6_9LILI|nr:hypothetical protein Cni_G13481 [Canna indica]
MDSLCRTYHRPLQLLLLSRRPAFSKPLFISVLKPSSSSAKPLILSIRAASSKSTAPPLPSVLRSASVAAAAALALFLFRLRGPALAATSLPPSPVAKVQPKSHLSSQDLETLTEAEQERALLKRLASHPDDVDSLRTLMALKVKMRKLDEAVAVVDRMIAVEPDDTDLRLLKAHLESHSGETENAKQGFEQLLEKDPFLVEAYHGLLVEASQSEDDGDLDDILRRVKDAMELCKKANKKEQLRDFRLLMAQISVIEGNYDDSLKIYQELIKEEPSDFRPYLYQGIVYSLLRKKDEAEKQFQKFRELVPKDHPYAQHFDDNMIAMKVFEQM